LEDNRVLEIKESWPTTQLAPSKIYWENLICHHISCLDNRLSVLRYAGKHVGAVKNVNGGVVSVISGCGQAGIMGVLVKPGEFGENILHQIIVL